jgi:hypothetical protein
MENKLSPIRQRKRNFIWSDFWVYQQDICIFAAFNKEANIV